MIYIFEYAKSYMKIFVMLSFIFFIGFVIALPDVEAISYYVDASEGNDAWSGTSQSEAWKTISRVNSYSFAPGDQVLFKRGEMWREQLSISGSGSSGNPIIFGAYGTGEKPIISGADKLSGWVQHSSTVWKAALSSEPRLVFFDGTPGNKKAALTDLISNQDWYWSSGSLYVYATSNPELVYSNKGVEATKRNYAVLISFEDYITITDVHATSGDNGVVEVWGGAYNTFDNIEVSYSGRNGLSLGEGSHHNLVMNSEVHHNGRILAAGNHGAGIILSEQSHDNTFDNVNCHHNAEDGLGVGGDETEGEHVIGGINNIIRNSWFHDNLEDGVDLKQGPQLVENNIIENNLESGMNAWDFAEYVVIKHNIIRNNARSGIRIGGTSISAQQADQHELYYNLIYDNNGYAVLAGGGSDTANGLIMYNNLFYSNNGRYGDVRVIGNSLVMKNNIIFTDSSYYCFNTDDLTGSDIDYNIYYNSAGNDVFRDSSAGKTYTASDLNSGVVFSEIGMEEHGIAEDPLFTDALNYDFHLQSTSPAIDAGVDVGLADDFDDNPIVGSPDIGAFEYQGGGSDPVAGDLDHDGDVDLDDLVLVSQDFGKTSGFNSEADLVADGKINIYDLVYVAGNMI